MVSVGLWQIVEDEPRRLKISAIRLEERLETWLVRDPRMLQAGLTVVCRQMILEGGKLDLLALDPQGRLVVIEIKRGTLYRETIAQALDYASCIATMPYTELSAKINAFLKTQRGGENETLESLLQQRQSLEDASSTSRSVMTIVVGTGKAPGLERISLYLSSTFGIPISVVTFEVFGTGDKQQILMRHVTETESEGVTPPQPRSPSIESVCSMADRTGIGPQFRELLREAERHGLFAKPFKTCIMYTSPKNRTRTLFTVWANPLPGGLISAWAGPRVFADYYPVSAEQAEAILGPEGWRKMGADDLKEFVNGLDQLFTSMQQPE